MTLDQKIEKAKALIGLGLSRLEVVDKLVEENISKRTAAYEIYQKANGTFTPRMSSNKKVGVVDWKELVDYIQKGQTIKQKASFNQDKGFYEIQTDEPIYVLALGDGHFGSWGTDYEVLKKVTKEILETPNLYVLLLGDMLQMSIKLRNVLEVSDNALPPNLQFALLGSWLNEIKHKVIAATWDNHSVMREEAVTGYSRYAEIFNRHTIYFNGIGHLDLKVGSQTYKLALSHFFRGYSIDNPCHGGMRYMRRQGVDREIALAGDSHIPGIIKYVDGPAVRAVVNSGTAQTNSGYAKRFYSLFTSSDFPVIKFDPHTHNFTPYFSLSEAYNI